MAIVPSSRLQADAHTAAAGLPPLLVAAERVAATVAQGVHGRRRVGLGDTFWQFRPYQPGDPIQRIDWRQSAKSRDVFIREQEWEAAQTVWLWRDTGPWMGFQSRLATETKRHRADLLLLALAILLTAAGERAALLDGEALPATGRASAERLALELDRGGEQPDAAPPIGSRVPRHGELVLFSDFLAPLTESARVVEHYAGRGVHGHLVQVLDPAEETLPYDGRVRFAGFRGEREVLIPRVTAVREAYQERFAAQADGLAALARTAGWSYAAHRSDAPPQAALLTLWGAMSATAQAG